MGSRSSEPLTATASGCGERPRATRSRERTRIDAGVDDLGAERTGAVHHGVDGGADLPHKP